MVEKKRTFETLFFEVGGSQREESDEIYERCVLYERQDSEDINKLKCDTTLAG